MSNKVVFWDFDGVIATSFKQAYTISRKSDPELTEDEYRRRFEGNINKAVLVRKPTFQVDFFKEYETAIFNALIAEGMTDVIKEISAVYPGVIISSTLTSIIDKYLTHNNLRKYFIEILGNEVAHSKVEKFKMAFEKHDTTSAHSVFVTDSLGDIVEAHEVAVPTIGVTWGYHPRQTLKRGKPTAIVEQPRSLTAVIRQLLE